MYAEFGRLNWTLKQKDMALSAMLLLISRLVTGEVNVNRVAVNLTDGQVSVVEEGQRASTPAQINGLPNVVVAPSPTENETLRTRVRELERALAAPPDQCPAESDPAVS